MNIGSKAAKLEEGGLESEASDRKNRNIQPEFRGKNFDREKRESGKRKAETPKKNEKRKAKSENTELIMKFSLFDFRFPLYFNTVPFAAHQG